jgi:hypothetical protein
MIKIKVKIKSVKTGSAIRQDVVNIFIKAIETKDPKSLHSDLQMAGIIPQKAIKMLKRGTIDPQFYSNACHIHNEMIKLYDYGEQMKIDAFADFPKPDSDDHRTPDKNWLRSPRLPSSTAQLDYRRGQKNLSI